MKASSAALNSIDKLVLAALATYVVGMLVLNALTGGSWNDVSLVDASLVVSGGWWSRLLIQPLTWIAGWVVIATLPGYPIVLLSDRINRDSDWATFLASVILYSIAGQILLGTIYKLIAVNPLGRVEYLTLLLTFSVLGRIGAMRKERELRLPALDATAWRSIILSLVFVILVVSVFAGKFFIEDFSDDGLEAYELARSLTTHLLPYWEVGYAQGTFEFTMVHPPGLAYLHLPSLLLFGFNEFAVRGLYLFCFLFFIPILVAMIREPRQPVYWLILLPVFFALGPLVQNSLFYAGMNPNFSDFAKCGEITLTLFFLAFLLMILRRNLWHALAFGLLTASIRWYGVFLIAIHFIVFALFIKELRRPLVIFIICVSALTLTAILIGVAGGYLEGWLETFRDEHLKMIVNTSALTTEAGSVVLHYSIFAGLLTPVLFLSWYRKQKFNLGLALGCIAYLIFTMMSSLYLNHFLVPIVLIPLVVLGRLLNTVEKRRIVVAVSSLALILQLTATWVLFPTKIPLHTAGRDLGRQTCILTDSFKEAIRLAQLLEYVKLGPSQWISYQTWTHYSTISSRPDPTCTLYVSNSLEMSDTYTAEVFPEVPSYLHIRNGEDIRYETQPTKSQFYRFSFLRPIIKWYSE